MILHKDGDNMRRSNLFEPGTASDN